MSRPPNNGPPVSFKTVPGRNKTQKWTVAKQYDYSGDDWGGYDPYEDYGGSEQQQATSPQLTYAQQLPSQQKGRQNSFDQGQETRQFSAGPVLYGGLPAEDNRGISPARSAVSAVSGTSSGGRPSNDYPRPRPREFTNPEQMPPPLNTRASPGPPSSTASPGGAAFPPRKSSVSSSSSPAPPLAPSDVKEKEKELPTPPFIRPSDIYKRMEAEREKERQNSLDSNSRASLDSLRRETDSPASSANAWQQRPLSAVEEGPDSSPIDQRMQVPEGFGEPREAGAALPPVTGVSSFGTDWLAGKNTTDEQAPPSTSTVQPTSNPAVPSSFQTTPIPTSQPLNPAPAPASETVAESSRDIPASASGRPPDELAHQPSQGYRSVVNRAFDHGANSTSIPATPISRDNSQSTSDMSRSNTNSTGNISPIMSRVPSQGRQQQQPPSTIAEEPSLSRIASEDDSTAGVAAAGAVATGAAAVGIAAGYRRSLDPPSSDNSPARTPGLEDTTSRRLSEGLAAETVTTEAPTVPDQGVEMQPTLQPIETPMSEISEPGALPETSSSVLPTRTGRARAGTDYSLRESDIADAVNSAGNSPNLGLEPTMSMSEAASAEKAEQNLFLQTHGTGTNTPISRTASPFTPGGGNVSPAAKGRVREIADKYHEIHEASRRNSQISGGITPLSAKSSWSRFGSEENLSKAGSQPKRQGTGTSNLVSESDYGAFEQEDKNRDSMRPELEREQSFRPHLPGEWVSFQSSMASTDSRDLSPIRGQQLSPGAFSAEPEKIETTPRASQLPPERQEDDGPVDLTPTTRKVSLQGTHNPQSDVSRFDQAKGAGSALGAAILAQVGLGHQTRDFGSSQPAQPVDQPEMQPKAPTGELGFLEPPRRPELVRGDTEATDATDATDIATPSVASSVPPTPPAKDTPPLSAPREAQSPGSENYFSVAPLRTRRSGEGMPEVVSAPFTSNRGPPGISPALSVYTRPGDSESDRLRKEIVRTLDSTRVAEEEDVERTQDALDAPDNARRIDTGSDALPPAEMSGESKPTLLMKRFSFEKDDGAGGLGGTFGSTDKELPAPPISPAPPVVQEPEHSPEIKPERPYERPSNRGLHVMNADDSDASEDEDVKPQIAQAAPVVGLGHNLAVATSRVDGVVSPITRSEENLDTTDHQRADSGDVNSGLGAPSPLSEGAGSLRLPSYYLQDGTSLGLEPRISGDEAAATNTRDVSDGAQTDVQDGTLKMDEVPPQPMAQDGSLSPTSPTTGKQKIPPFREILAIKEPADRIRKYDETRQTFADMNTGLSDWLNTMLINHPEHASLATDHGGYKDTASGIGSIKGGHKASPSLAKFTKSFNIPGTSSHTNAPQPGAQGDFQPGAEPVPPKTPNKDLNVDMDKLQQRGKDLMKNAGKNAGVLGGKAQAGAKGLFAKGRRQLGSMRESGKGGNKDLSSSSIAASQSDTNTSLARHISAPGTSKAAILHQPKPVHARSTSENIPAPDSRSSTPLQLSRTHTPSSLSSAGGALSRTLSKLRDRSRSHSRKGSRPSSVVLVNSSELASVVDASPAGDYEPRTIHPESVTSEALATISPWDEPGATNLDEELERNSGMPERLGVLPSPTTATFSVNLESPPKSAVHAADFAAEDAPSYFGQATTDEGKDESQLVDFPGLRPNTTSRSVTPISPKTEMPVEKKAEDEGDDEELYESTPFASKLDVSRPEGGVQDKEIPSTLTKTPERSGEADEPPTPAFGEALFDADGKQEGSLPEASRDDAGQNLDAHDDLHESTAVSSNALPGIIGEQEDSTPVASKADLPQDPDTKEAPHESAVIASAALPAEKNDEEANASTKVITQAEQETTPSDAVAEPGDEELYESTPKAVKSLWETGSTEATSGDDEGELDENTPTTTQREWRDNQAEIVNDQHNGSLQDTGLGSISNPLMLQAERERLLGFQKPADTPHLHISTLDGGDAASSVYSGLEEDGFDEELEVSADRKSEIAHADIQVEAGDDLATRTSSVSSLGHHVQIEPQSGEPAERAESSSRAIPAVPSNLAPVSQEDKFMNRPYHTNPDQPRPLSYEPRDRDASGALVQESLDTITPSRAANDASASQPQSPSTTALTRHRKHPSSPADGPKSKRYSGVFGGREPTAKPLPTTRPSASAISDHYGLEDLPVDPANLIVDDEPLERDEPPRRRKSGILESFRRTPGASRENILTEASNSQPKVLQKPHRSSTSALPNRSSTSPAPNRSSTSPAQPEQQQKKRFSGIGSLFGRSSTTSQKSEKPKKLLKAQPSTKDRTQRQSVPPGGATGNSSTYEAQRRQQIPNVVNQEQSIYPPPNVDPPPQYEPRAAPPVSDDEEIISPPPGGWYAPGADFTAQPAAVNQNQPQQLSGASNTEQLHESANLNQSEALRPVGGSFSRPFAPLMEGHPEVYRPTGMSPHPINTAGYGSQRPPERRQSLEQQFTPGQQRQYSYSSADYQLSPQISGQSDWERGDWRTRGSSPSISPIQSRTNSDTLLSGRTTRMGSISEEVVRSPVRQYSNQPMLRADNMPRIGENTPGSFQQTGRYGADGRSQRNDYVPAEDYGYSYEPTRGQYSGQQGFSATPRLPISSMPPQLPPVPTSETLMAHAPIAGVAYSGSFMGTGSNAYSSSSYSSRGFPSPNQRQNSQRSYQMQYYEDSRNNQGPPPPRPVMPSQRQFSGDPQFPYPRRPSGGYIGRRDDPSASEEQLEMRGSSYPGQEWSPNGWE